MDPALLALISPLYLALLGTFWQLSRENSKTREYLRGEMTALSDKLHNENRALSDKLHNENKELRRGLEVLGDGLRGDHKELRDELGGEIKVLGVGLGDVRERLAGIEGFLRIGMLLPAGPVTSE